MGEDKDSKTEEPTAHKISEARKDGNVFQSRDVATVVMILGVFTMVRIMFPVIYKHILAFFRFILDAMAQPGSNPLGAPLFYRFIVVALICSLPILLVAMILGVLSHGVQTRFNVSRKSLRPKFERINPLAGIKRLFSLRNIVETLKSLLKIIILITLLYTLLKADLLPLSRMIDMPPKNSALALLSIIWGLIIRVVIAFSIIAFFDFLFQKRQYHKDLMMTKQEVKDEMKMLEGNLEMKNKMKQQHRQMTNRRMMQNVPSADVIVRNPTHVAVALKYDPDHHGAPYVVAKGVDHMALRIVEIGTANNVPWMENKPLARALYSTCEVGQEIPQEYYGAVAELLVYIYKQSGREDIFQ